MPGGFSSGFSSGFGGRGTFRFLVDHYVDNEIIPAGTTRFMNVPWLPTPDVDPVDSTAVSTFYFMGPRVGSPIVSQWVGSVIAPPVTHWYQISPNYWALSGLGSNQSTYPPIHAIIGRL